MQNCVIKGVLYRHSQNQRCTELHIQKFTDINGVQTMHKKQNAILFHAFPYACCCRMQFFFMHFPLKKQKYQIPYGFKIVLATFQTRQSSFFEKCCVNSFQRFDEVDFAELIQLIN